ncbi:ATP-binding response regulator [Stratiformator vulcanicus]|uniref:histidine kinase n=1 Tax=Stratiformator vulcanicus TaxID=2527980 RepID=A0A517QVZ3_9PLAN|nr:ATP-binding protein [Stratiformator vulcanicus]QDT35747.1 Autoinducer 2 sensor kinase/phosphatase LuxQ [Stratiformator vulcanicus]
MPNNERLWKEARRYGFAASATLIATWLRLLAAPLLDDRVPFGFFFLSVILTAWRCGTGPAVFAVIFGIALVDVFVIPTHYATIVNSPADSLALLVYAFATLVTIALFERTKNQRRAAEQNAAEIAKLNENLREAAQKKDEFMALLAHELRNPLAPLRSGIELLDRPEIAWRQGEEILNRMRRQMRHLVRIVDDLLDVSRFLQGTLRLNRNVVDLRTIVRDAIEMTQPEIDRQQHELKFLRPPLPIYIYADMVRLVQIVSNLLTNAAKYTPRCGLIVVTLDRNGGQAVLQVADNGIGIANSDRDKIFELFGQASGARVAKEGGLGLGLALVRHLTDMHDGVVEAESDGPGCGATFRIRLPLATPSQLAERVIPDETLVSKTKSSEPEGVASQSLQSQPIPVSGSDGEALRVLIVDDNVDAAETLGTLLSLDGYETQHVFDGVNAIDAVEEFQPAAVLLDLGMPGMDGYEVARRMRQLPEGRQLKIIAVTGWGGEEDRRRSAEAGFDEHFAKPVDPAMIAAFLSDREAVPR